MYIHIYIHIYIHTSDMSLFLCAKCTYNIKYKIIFLIAFPEQNENFDEKINYIYI